MDVRIEAPAPSGSVVSDAGESAGGGQNTAGCGEEEDGEQEEDSSSSQPSAEVSIEDALAMFRQQWHQELQKPSSADDGEAVQRPAREPTREEKARTLYLLGVHYEQSGDMFEAIQHYRRAIQLDADVELKSWQFKLPMRERTDSETSTDTIGVDRNGNPHSPIIYEEEEEEEDDDDVSDLITKFQRVVARVRTLCQPESPQTATHVSDLPVEVFVYILKWVVSSDLDMRSLEQMSEVCRGFYLCCRDPGLWRLACLRVWGVSCGRPSHWGSWRDMYIERPHLRFNGCYISKTTYVRSGESSFQDQFYRPWHLVNYYRYLRFFPEGLVLMLTTPDTPIISLPHLRMRTTRHPHVLTGHYRLHGNKMLAVVKPRPVENKVYKYRRRQEPVHDVGQQTFHLELEVRAYRDRPHWQLVWLGYSVRTTYKTRPEAVTHFDIHDKFPPFWFSRVRSYTSESAAPLR